MEKTRVKLTICGNDYYINTDDDPKYVQELGAELDQALTRITKDNHRLSMTQAAILCALDYADEAHKANESADNLRNQIRDYMEDSQKYKMEAEVNKREVDRLNKELQAGKPF